MTQRNGTRLGSLPVWKLKKWLPAVLAAAAGLGGPVTWALAQTPPPVPAAPAPAAQPEKKDAAAEAKTVSINFALAEWKDVLEWFSKESGLQLISAVRPTGSVTLTPGKDKKFTMSETVDLLNELLIQQKFLLIRREQSFFIWPTDEKLDPYLIPRITVADLGKRGKSELVQVIITLKGSIPVEEHQEEIKKMLGPTGTMLGLVKPNAILMMDTAGNILRVLETIKIFEGGNTDTLTHACKYRKARELAETLKTLLKDRDTDVTASASSGPSGGFGFSQDPRSSGFGGGFSRGGGDFSRGGGDFSRGGGEFSRSGDFGSRDFGSRGDFGARGMASAPRTKSVQITVENRSNTLIIVAPPDKIAQAKTIIEDIDKPLNPGDKPIVIAPPELRTYPVPMGTAELFAKTLQEQYPANRILAVPNSNQVMVYGTPDEHKDIQKEINPPNADNPNAGVQAKVIPLSVLDPGTTAATLVKAFPASTSGGPMIEVNTGLQSGIFIRGSADQIKEAEKIIEALGEKPGAGGVGAAASNMRIIPLDNGSAATLAEVLKSTMQGMGKNPVIIQNMNNPNMPAAAPPAVRPQPAPQPSAVPPPMKVPTMPQSRGPGTDVQYIVAQIADPQKNDQKPVVISVVGNRLVITSEDPAALELLSQVARLYTQGGDKPNENLFEVIRLRMVSATDAAAEITEIFNGPQQAAGGQRPGQGGGIGALFGGGGLGALLGGGGNAPPAPGRVRVVAEKSSNSLIVVKASPLDLATIKKLLRDAIDGGPNDDVVTQRTFIIELKNAEATAMASTIKDVYKSALGSTGGGGGGAAGFPFPFAQPQGGGQAAKPPALTVGTDDRTNSIVLQCSEVLYTEIKFLVDQLEAKTTNTNEVVRVVPLKGIDPSLVLAAIDAVRGVDPKLRNQQNQRGGFGQGGQGGGQGGLGGGGQGMGGFGGGNPFGGGGLGGLGLGGFGGGQGAGGRGAGGAGGFGGGQGAGGRGAGGGGATGGGGTRGGGGGGAKGGRVASLMSGEGPLNFDYRGTDAPSAVNTIYDPEDTGPVSLNILVYPGAVGVTRTGAQIIVPGQPGAAQPGGLPPMKQPDPPLGAQPQGFGIASPRGTVQAYTLDEAGLLFLRTADTGDMDILLSILKYLQEESKGLQPKLEVVPLKNQDCNYVATTLNSIFARVLVGASGNSIPAGARNVQSNLLTGLTGAPSQTQNVYCVALPRFNSILIAGPGGRFPDILKEVERIDVPNGPQTVPVWYQLKNQPAQVIAQQIQQFWNQRYPGEALSANQFRLNFDLKSNSVFVQASPTDQKDVAALIHELDSRVSQAVNEVRVFKLRNAFADELGQTIVDALTSNLVNPIVQSQQQGVVAQGGIAAALGLAGGQQPAGGQQLAQLGQQFGQLGQQQRTGTGQTALQALTPSLGTSAAGGMSTKVSSIKFFANDGKYYEAGHLADVHVIPNTRTNSLVIAAPTETMKLIEKLIDNLDTTSAGQSFINVYTLTKADALLTASLISQVFTGQGRTTTGGAQQQQGQQAQQAGLAGQTTARPLITISGNVSDGATLVDLRITVDDRTNSLVVAGAQNDLDTIRALIGKLESVDTPQRITETYKLRHAAAADVQTALQAFITNSLNVFTGAQFLTAYQTLQKQVVIQAEPVTNRLIVSATPQYLAEFRRIIDQLDAAPPQVVIKVTIAEVQLNNTQEMGVETGLQSRVLFNRGVTAAGGTVALPGGAATPGFNFNTTAALPNGVVDQGLVGFQGLGNLGVGRTSGTQGVGGFVFSAANESFTVLVRALQAQGRIEVLSSPQVQVADNQTGYVQIGQDFPYLTASTVAQGGLAQQSVEYRSIGVTMRVTPRVSPDGKILMRVEPQVSSVTPGAVSLGNGIQSPAFNIQTVQTTVLASDGETIVLGGLISKQDNRQENGIPFFKNIPYVGALFRYRTHQVQKRELIIIMTPHIIRNEMDQARVLSEESRRMTWCVPDVAKVHGYGMEVIGPAMKGANPVAMPAGAYTTPSGAYTTGPAYFGPMGGDANPGMIFPQGAAVPPGMMGQPIAQPGMVVAQPTMIAQPGVMAQPPVTQTLPAFAPPATVPTMLPAVPAAPPAGMPVSMQPMYSGAVSAAGPAVVAPPMSMAPAAPAPGGPLMPVAPTSWTPPAQPRRTYAMIPTAEANGTPPAQPAHTPTEGKQWETFGR